MLRVFGLPDFTSFNYQSLLRACIYFDEVYVDTLVPEMTKTIKDGEYTKSITFNINHLSPDEWTHPLREAAVLKHIPDVNKLTEIPFSFNTHELPDVLRKDIANSLAVGTDFLASYFLWANTGDMTIPLSNQYTFRNPEDKNDPRFELAISSHLTTIFTMLINGRKNDLTPILGNMAHANLLKTMTETFPEIAKALGFDTPELSRTRHAAVAKTVLNELLPPIKVNHADQILELRENLKSELDRFRSEIGKLSAAFDGLPWSNELEMEVEKMLAEDIRPALAELRQYLENPGRRVLKHLVSDWKAISSSAAVPLVAMFQQDLSLPVSLFVGSTTGLGIAAIKAKVEEWALKNKCVFSFVLEAERSIK